MNYHTDRWIQEQIQQHYNFALTLYKPEQIIGVFCQGSQNYKLDTINSDIDTKCIIVPTFKDICLANPPISTTHILDNNEHLDAKDIRLYCQCFRKQNLNFLEILFTPYCIINPAYREEWNRLIEAREFIARMNPYRAVKSMKGIALEKFHAMEHRYPSKADIIDKYGYDPKQVSHLIRIYDYLSRYILGESYQKCLKPSEEYFPFIFDMKLSKYSLEEARVIADQMIEMVTQIADEFCAQTEEVENEEMRKLLEDVSYNIMKISVEAELGKINHSYHKAFD